MRLIRRKKKEMGALSTDGNWTYMDELVTNLDPGHDPRCQHYEWGPCTCARYEARQEDKA